MCFCWRGGCWFYVLVLETVSFGTACDMCKMITILFLVVFFFNFLMIIPEPFPICLCILVCNESNNFSSVGFQKGRVEDIVVDDSCRGKKIGQL